MRVIPGAKRAYVGGVREGPGGERRLLVRVSAPPDKGRANAAVIAALADALGLAKTSLTLTAGARERNKTISIDDPPADIAARVAALMRKTA